MGNQMKGKAKAEPEAEPEGGVVSMEEMEAYLGEEIKLPKKSSVIRRYNNTVVKAMENYADSLEKKLNADDGETSSKDLLKAAEIMGLYEGEKKIKNEEGNEVTVPAHITDVEKFMENVRKILNAAKEDMKAQIGNLMKTVKGGGYTYEADVIVKGLAPGAIMGVMKHFGLSFNRASEKKNAKTAPIGFGRKRGESISDIAKIGGRDFATVVLRWRGKTSMAQNITISSLVPEKEEPSEFQKKRV